MKHISFPRQPFHSPNVSRETFLIVCQKSKAAAGNTGPPIPLEKPLDTLMPENGRAEGGKSGLQFRIFQEY